MPGVPPLSSKKSLDAKLSSRSTPPRASASPRPSNTSGSAANGASSTSINISRKSPAGGSNKSASDSPTPSYGDRLSPAPPPAGISIHNSTAKEIFERVVAAKVCVLRKYGSQDAHHISPILEAACKTAEVEPPLYLNIHQQQALEILDCVQRPGLPLIFVNGDCIGGLTELRELNKSGFLAEALRPHQYDLIVVGGGSGGLAAAKEAARLGKKVACLDYVKPTPTGTEWGLGGTCVNVGCIPKKLMHQSALLGEAFKDSKYFGWSPGPSNEKPLFSWSKLKDAIQDHIATLNWNYRVQLREKKVTYLNAYGRFTGLHEITAVNKKGKEEKITADRFLIAVGLRPKYVDAEGAKEVCITSDDLFSLPYPPGKTLCIGASYVSLECAGFLHGVGYDVAVLVRSILLRGFDQDMAEKIRKHMIEKGIKFHSGVPVKFERLKEPDLKAKEPGLIRVTWNGKANPESENEEEFTEEFNTVLLAIGREAKTDDIGVMDVLQAKLSKSLKLEGRREQSMNMPHLYGVGDVLEGMPELTPVAIQAGRVLMRRLYTGNMELTEYDQVPTTVFTPLEYGACGISEEAAKEKYGEENINVWHNRFTPLEYTLPERMDTQHCYSKLICLKNEQDKVIGFHYLGPNAGEVTQGFAIALKLGATKADFDRLIGIHPTCAEVFTTLTVLKTPESGELEAGGC